MNDDDDLRRRFRRVRSNEDGLDWGDVEERAGVSRTWRPFHLRLGVAVATALLIGSGLGFALGTSNTPSSSAASGPVGMGFLPEAGWDVRQSGAPATLERPAVAIASNVPLSSEDSADGFPLTTLQSLPAKGVVIVVGFTRRLEHRGISREFPVRKLPLRVRDASQIEFGTQVRPRRPLGQYRLGATVNRYEVDVSLYFGAPKPGRALLVAAQRQLDRLVVRSPAPEDRVQERALPFQASASAPRIIDRTLVCTTALVGGVRKITVRGHRGIRQSASEWRQLAFAVVASGTVASATESLDVSLAWITAGAPGGHTSMDQPTGWPHYPHNEGTVAFNRRHCTPSAARVPLVPARMDGGAASPLGEEIDCFTPRRVLVRLRAVMQSPPLLFGAQSFLKSIVPARESSLAVRTLSGKPLVFANVLASGRAKLYTARSCVPS
jgi:hypothetical protein